MFGFVKRLFRRDRRAVFRFKYRGAWEYRDPVAVEALLVRHGGAEWGELVGQLSAANKPLPPLPASLPVGTHATLSAQRAERVKRVGQELADLVCRAFGVEALTSGGRGLTVGERLDLLASYLNWCEGVRLRTLPLPDRSPGTD